MDAQRLWHSHASATSWPLLRPVPSHVPTASWLKQSSQADCLVDIDVGICIDFDFGVRIDVGVGIDAASDAGGGAIVNASEFTLPVSFVDVGIDAALGAIVEAEEFPLPVSFVDVGVGIDPAPDACIDTIVEAVEFPLPVSFVDVGVDAASAAGVGAIVGAPCVTVGIGVVSACVGNIVCLLGR